MKGPGVGVRPLSFGAGLTLRTGLIAGLGQAQTAG